MKHIAISTAVVLAALSMPAQAALITNASLFTPLAPVGANTTVIDLAPIVTPRQTFYNGGAFQLSFSNVGAQQGVVQNASANVRAIPVAGQQGGAPTYLVNNLGGGTTTNAAASGNYLSTGGTGSTITITFDAPKTSLALLWGSVDRTTAQNAGNLLTFSNGDTLTGAEIQALAAGFLANGSQGPGGSVYVSTTSSSTFTSVTLSSGVVSFEAAGIVGSDRAFTTVPEPMSIALLGMGLLGMGMVRRRA